MELMFILLVLWLAWQALRARYQAGRIAFLGRHLSGMQVERHMETLTQGYLRALHEDDPVRQQQIWETFAAAERAVAAQVARLAEAIGREDADETRISRWLICVPWIERVLPAATRDFRPLLALHAEGIRGAVENTAGWDAKERAFHLSAELFLLQHSCHWFCKSRLVADARLQARHKVGHQKVLESVTPATREAYRRWLAS
ncbi:hypothetical protein D8I35_05140 [Corticibacter populi]|uniref:Uncharacterized protein n=1 Tax=Corticibacter populi TaxID=1550736 RepID=A0A3M6QZK7_9BURK|nr:hypothetical protein [Corticibacter populi]RMX08466.1 hypothetical protein D8I35_05140 [Corticibacter populi]RZS35778.1 hypothetical protein EV687_0856 [Corticibacter populi]